MNTAEGKTGAQVTVVNAITMDGFESQALGRKFDRIVFGSLAGTAAPEARTPTVPPGRGAATADQAAASSHHRHQRGRGCRRIPPCRRDPLTARPSRSKRPTVLTDDG